MTDVIAWACTICAGAAVCLLCEMLLPKDKISKAVRFAVGVFMVGIIIVPLGSIGRTISDELSSVGIEERGNASELEDRAELDGAELAKENVARLVRNQLEDMGVNAERIEIKTDSDKLSDITGIESVIYINEKDRGQSLKIKNRIDGRLGLSCKIVVIGEGENGGG